VNNYTTLTEQGPVMIGFELADVTNYSNPGTSDPFTIEIKYTSSNELIFRDNT